MGGKGYTSNTFNNTVFFLKEKNLPPVSFLSCARKGFIMAWDQVPSLPFALPSSSPHPQFVASKTWMRCLLSLLQVF